eukprot:3730761-Amphidinium_carterae.1
MESLCSECMPVCRQQGVIPEPGALQASQLGTIGLVSFRSSSLLVGLPPAEPIVLKPSLKQRN